jgi:transcriptional regulator with XRE-family HTH domain
VNHGWQSVNCGYRKTQASLAAEAGVSQPFLAQIEAGKRRGTVAILARIARALGVRIDDLVDTKG